MILIYFWGAEKGETCEIGIVVGVDLFDQFVTGYRPEGSIYAVSKVMGRCLVSQACKTGAL